MAETKLLKFNELPLIEEHTIRQGETIERKYAIQVNSAGTAYADDLSACTITVAVETTAGTTVSITYGTIAATGTGTNNLLFHITATDTADWTDEYEYEVQCTWPTADDTFTKGATRVLVAGKIKMQDTV